MDSKLCVYIDFDVTKLRENGAVVRASRTLKLVCDELHFECIEPGVWEFEGPERDDLAAYFLMITRFKQFDLWDKLEYFLVRYGDGTIENGLEETRKAEEVAKVRAEKLGWLDADGNIIPLPKRA